MSICPHHLVKDVLECHQRFPSNGGWSSGGRDFECIVDVCIKCVVDSTIYVASCIVVVFLVLEGCRDMQHLFARVWYNSANCGLDFREFWYSGIVWDVEFFHVEGRWIDERVHCGT